MGARPLFVLKDACRSLYPIGFVISTQYTSHRKSIQNHEGRRRHALGSLCRNRLRILPSNKHGNHDGNKRGHRSRENRLPPVQPRHHREPHLQSAAIKKRIGSRCEHGAGTACFPFLIPSHKNAWFISRTKPGIMLRVSAFKNICCQLMKVVFWYCKIVAQQIFEKQ